MCDLTTSARRASLPRPRWRLLYGIVLLMVGALTAVESVGSPGSARTALEYALAIGGVAAMEEWVRRNRGALDRQDWCACAAETITVRVIASRGPAPERLEDREDVLEEVTS